ncbi:hypothetical protein V2W45_1470742 [Cenococcum geophilum]
MVKFSILKHSGSLSLSLGEIHLYLNLFSIFYGRPSFRGKTVIADKLSGLSLNEIVDSIYTRLLFPFIDIFYFFYADLSSFRQIARYITTYTYLRVVIITEKIPLGLLEEEIIKDLSKLILAINIVAFFPNGIMSINARYRRLKEPLRIYNPVASNLVKYLLNFLKYIKSTNKLTEFVVLITTFSLFLDSYPPKVYTFKQSNHVILQSGFINMYCLPYGHYICENYIIVEEMPNDIIIKVYPLTIGVGVLYINRGDCFYTTSIGTKIGLPVAIVSSYLLYYIFTNYNRALLEVLVIFLLIKEPNFIISLGTSNTDFNTTKPRLNNTRSIPKLKLKVKIDYSLSARINTIVRYIIISLFYFELDSLLERYNRKYIVTGYILYLITRSDLAFGALLSKLVNNFAGFLINDWLIPGTFNNTSFIGKNRNFQKRVDLDTFRKFIISLKEGDAKPYNISRKQ